MDTKNLNGIEGKVLLTGTSGAAVLVTGGNSSSSNADGTVSNPVANAEQSVQVQQPVGLDSESVKPQLKLLPSEGNLEVIADYSGKK
jgi:hypothetical protein